MKITTLLVFALLLIPAWAMAQDTAAQSAPAKTFIIHLANGGQVETDNFTVEKENNRVKVMLPNGSGSIYLDRGQVKSIEEVQGVEKERVRNIEVAPTTPQPQRPAPPSARPPMPPKMKEAEPYEPTDNNGHNEKWWRKQVDGWKRKRDLAEQRYNKALADWNNYQGVMQGLTATVTAPLTDAQKLALQKQGLDHVPTPDELKALSGENVLELQQAGVATTPTTTVGSQYDLTRTQDESGSARVRMDQAQADINEANRQMNDVLPEEARKAGAPPGWVR